MRKIIIAAAATTVLILGSGVGAANASANSEPIFQVPLNGGVGVYMTTYPGHDQAQNSTEPIDFSVLGTEGDGDLGTPIVAAARGRVYYADSSSDTRATWGGYGRDVRIDHGNGWTSIYGHLRKVNVTAGQIVSQGQQIGTMGDSTNNSPASTANGGETTMTVHLHYEVRLNGVVKAARFDGYNPVISSDGTRVNLTSRNYGNDPEALCGSGYEWIDLRELNSGGIHYGTVYLMWNGSSQRNCTVTVKHRNRGTQTSTSAYIQPVGGTRASDSGNYYSYAGPKSAVAPGCIYWGGSTSGIAFNSGSSHC